MDIVFYKKIRNGLGQLTYTSVDNGQPLMETIGSIWISDSLEKLKILVYEPIDAQNKTTTNLRIIAPAKTYDEALLIDQSFD